MPPVGNEYQGSELILECGHTVYIRVKLRYQYTDDIHYVLCNKCVQDKKRNKYGFPPSAWQLIINEEPTTNAIMSNVLDWTSFCLPDGIMRLQPSVPKHRIRPFPYKGG